MRSKSSLPSTARTTRPSGQVDVLLRERASLAEDEGLVVLLDESGCREAGAQVAGLVVVVRLPLELLTALAEEVALGAMMPSWAAGSGPSPSGQSTVACLVGSMPYSRLIGPSHSTR